MSEFYLQDYSWDIYIFFPFSLPRRSKTQWNKAHKTVI